ncbi:MAG: hypothetical protein AAGJ80_17705 [Cyanobacteria bacterium J06553_1]
MAFAFGDVFHHAELLSFVAFGGLSDAVDLNTGTLSDVLSDLFSACHGKYER